MFLKNTIKFGITLFLAFNFLACESKKEIEKINVDIYTLKKETYPIWIDFSGKTEAVKDVKVIDCFT